MYMCHKLMYLAVHMYNTQPLLASQHFEKQTHMQSSYAIFMQSSFGEDLYIGYACCPIHLYTFT